MRIDETAHLNRLSEKGSGDASCRRCMHCGEGTLILNEICVNREEGRMLDEEILLGRIEGTVHGEASGVDCSFVLDGPDCEGD